jgi:hypothetical protein
MDLKISFFLTATIQSRNLESSDKVRDPVYGDEKEGNLPWDRYYGNNVSIRIANSGKTEAELIIPIRVLHKVDERKIPVKINFIRDVMPLFSYYMRYYPWLHVTVEDCRYNQLIDLNDPTTVLKSIRKILQRLRLDDADWQKMPRSRDFPRNGEKVLERLECILSTDSRCGLKE